MAIKRRFEGVSQIGIAGLLPGRGSNNVDIFQSLVNQLTQEASNAKPIQDIQFDPSLLSYKSEVIQGFLRTFVTHSELANELGVGLHETRANDSLLPAL